ERAVTVTCHAHTHPRPSRRRGPHHHHPSGPRTGGSRVGQDPEVAGTPSPDRRLGDRLALIGRPALPHVFTVSPAPWFAPLLFSPSMNATTSSVTVGSSGDLPVLNISTICLSNSR